MFGFYEIGYIYGIFPKSEIQEVTDLGILTPEEYKAIVGEEYKPSK